VRRARPADFLLEYELEGEVVTQQRALALRIQSYIAAHLHEPDLTPGVVAAANHISVSHLHRLFQTKGVTVSAWIRQQRLERARRDLADPTLRTVRVHHIAEQWGFTHHAVFTRAFRATYGVPPSEYRMRRG
jgi:AraC-like DNA-binding protein